VERIPLSTQNKCTQYSIEEATCCRQAAYIIASVLTSPSLIDLCPLRAAPVILAMGVIAVAGEMGHFC
jgi:hypothetical protein